MPDVTRQSPPPHPTPRRVFVPLEEEEVAAIPSATHGHYKKVASCALGRVLTRRQIGCTLISDPQPPWLRGRCVSCETPGRGVLFWSGAD